MAAPSYTKVDHIPQSPLTKDDYDKTTPEIGWIRSQLEGKLPQVATIKKVDLETWLQIYDRDMAWRQCVDRAEDLAIKLNPSKASTRYFTQSTSKLSIQDQWKSVDTLLEQKRPVVIDGFNKLICGTDSNFIKPESGHHAILLIARGPDFYVGLDPDTGATATTKDAWAPFDTLHKEDAPDKQRLKQAIDTMILGTTGAGLGPVCRKYEVDKSKFWPAWK